uniref:Wnt ligand secretion mediator n=1 Tax=Suricata suricatta TaxID=37032 RepID=A0A673UF04_SURSU
MAGAIIENMSTKKLCIVGGILLVFQIIAFLVGGLIAPGPTTAVSYMSVKCVDVRKNHHKTKWLMPWGPNQCDKIRDIEEAIPREIEANDIVFSVHIPLPSMEMSPWFQFMLFILQLDIAFKLNNQIPLSLCTAWCLQVQNLPSNCEKTGKSRRPRDPVILYTEFEQDSCCLHCASSLSSAIPVFSNF